MLLSWQDLREAICRHLRGLYPLDVQLTLLVGLSKPHLVDIHMFELCLKLLSSLCDYTYSLLVITVDNRLDTHVKAKLLEQVVPPNEI
jgi:hypothetical protein